MKDALAVYAEALDTIAHLSRAEIAARLAEIPWPGARPTEEHDRYPNLVVPFDLEWDNHAQARTWARQVLEGVPTIAVDGSQITPTQDLSLPLGAVQIGWFVNPHHSAHAYVKDVDFEVLSPDELTDEADAGEALSGFPDWRVNLRRFVGECHKLVALMEIHREAASGAETVMPVCFFDGSLIISFAQQMRPERQRQYVAAVTELLDASEHYRVPLVGYVDTSYANDLVMMLDTLMGNAPTQRVSDGMLLRSRHMARRMMWGDRTTAFVCVRNDALEPLGGSKYYDRVVFTYLQTTADRDPARLDVPRWLLDAGLLEHTLDVVRAECVVGNGYPYAVETADAVAVITQRDRERFYRLFQAFAEAQGLPLRFSRKAVSKVNRRTAGGA